MKILLNNAPQKFKPTFKKVADVAMQILGQPKELSVVATFVDGEEMLGISNLIYFMKTMLSEVFKRDVKVRLRPGFFPFVEPGFELDINCEICGGDGCPSCKNSGWLELCPCGMIHPNVLSEGGIDTEKYSGFAFGLGLTRLAMMRYGVKDIRDFNSGNLKALSQFKSI